MALEKEILNVSLQHIPMKKGEELSADAGVADAVRAMLESNMTSVLVAQDGKVVGIFTERDALHHGFQNGKSVDSRLQDVMTANPKMLHTSDTMEDAIHMMNENDYRHIPILDANETILGVLTIQDVIHFISETFPGEVLNVPPKVHQQHDTVEGG